MATSENELQKIAALAYIEPDNDGTQQLANDVNSIMNFIDQLRQVDTTNILPLRHPLQLHQHLRLDQVSEINSLTALAKIAPMFADDLYLVPKLGPFANEGK